MEKYREKVKKVEDMKKYWSGLLGGEEGVVELVDSAGERKYCRTKRD